MAVRSRKTKTDAAVKKAAEQVADDLDTNDTKAGDDNADDGDENRGPDTPDGPGVRSAMTDSAEGGDDDTDADEDADGDDADDGDEAETGETGTGDSVTMRSNDGATMKSNDGATGDNNDDRPNTKAGDAPEGVDSDRNPGERAATGAMSAADASVAEMAPAASMHGAKPREDLTERTLLILGDFASNKGSETFTGQANLFDDLNIERAEIPALRDEVAQEFDVDITISEAQNWLLVRDVVNTVFRKVAAQG